MEKTYSPANRCIYCGAENCVLTDEHIIPYSLGGVLVLPKSCCPKCQKIIHTYEYTCGRRIFGNFRMRHNLPTRRKKQRPTFIEIGTDSGTGINVSTREYPAPLVLYKFEKPNILQGLSPDSPKFDWVPVVVVSTEELNRFKAKYHWDGQLTFTALPVEFARMLAKIGHSYAVAELGLGSFRPLALDIILSRTDKVSYLVGGDMEIPAAIKDGKHVLEITYRTDLRAWGLVTVDIRFFSGCETPVYHVVVGDLDMTNPEHMRAMNSAMEKSKSLKTFL